MKSYLSIAILMILATSAESLTDGRHNKFGAMTTSKSLLDNHRGRRRGSSANRHHHHNNMAVEHCAHWYDPEESKEKFVEEYMRYCWST